MKKRSINTVPLCVRISASLNLAIEAECHKRLIMTGEKPSRAELIRELVAAALEA